MPAKKEIKKLLSVTDNRLKELREQKGFTQLNVQMETGIDQSDYSKLERGLRKPTYDQAALLSHLFDTSIDYIYGLRMTLALIPASKGRKMTSPPTKNKRIK